MLPNQPLQLNFYSKFNRVRQKQQLTTLFSLISQSKNAHKPYENLIFTLNTSRSAANFDRISPGRKFNSNNHAKGDNLLAALEEEKEKGQKMDQMQQKLKRLQLLQKNFYSQLQRGENQYQRKRSQPDFQARRQQTYREDLMNVIEQTSQHDQYDGGYSKQSQAEMEFSRNRLVSSLLEENMEGNEQFGYVSQKIDQKQQNTENMDKGFNINETKRKLRLIIQMQKQREREVESVEQNLQAKASSIVIQRLKISPKGTQSLKNALHFQTENRNHQKPTRNYYQLQLTHSQSENVLRNVHSIEKLDFNQRIAQADEYQMNNQPTSRQQKYLQNEKNQQHPSIQYQHENLYYQQYRLSQQINHISQSQSRQDQNQFTIQDASEINEQIADHVKSIGQLSEQHSHSPVASTPKGPLYLSQTSPRQVLQNQHEVQSISESLDFHPLENRASKKRQKSPQNFYIQKQVKSRIQLSPQHGNKKSSFKKMMAQNRANLVPRLAISTILNEHINEALGDYRSNNHLPQPPSPAAGLHQSIIDSEQNSTVKPVKVNFKMLMKQSKNSPASHVKLEQKDVGKVQENKKLFMGFFEQN